MDEQDAKRLREIIDPIMLRELAEERPDLWPQIEQHPSFHELSDSLRRRISAGREPSPSDPAPPSASAQS